MSASSPLLGRFATAAAERLRRTLGLDPATARLEARILICHALSVPPSYLVGHDRDPLPPEGERACAALLERRLQQEPVAYIVGVREFYGLEFRVTPAVLIPRPETELLVELALERMAPETLCTVLDLGAGSGAIAVTLATHRPWAKVTAVDRSPEALAVAQENALRHGAANLRLLRSDWFDGLEGEKFDLIVSNPPYIAAGDPHLNQGDVRFEPPSALASGPDGLDDIRRIVSGAPPHLNPGGWLLLEHGYDQGERCRKLLRENGFVACASAADLAGIPRVTYGRLPPQGP